MCHRDDYINYMAPTLNSTLDLIILAHGNQKYGDRPYWIHPVRVLEQGRVLFGAKFDFKSRVAALLHDVLEDTSVTAEDLRTKGYSETIIEVVQLLTKDSALTYAQNIQRIIDSGNRRAMMVKLADNEVNLQTAPPARVDRYRKSISKLIAAMG